MKLTYLDGLQKAIEICQQYADRPRKGKAALNMTFAANDIKKEIAECKRLNEEFFGGAK